MNKSLPFLTALLFLCTNILSAKDDSHTKEKGSKATTEYTLTVFDEILFFDGYAATVSLPVPPPDVIRHRNDLYAKKLTDDQLLAFGPSLIMNVTVKAACDNYDRIGNVNLALVPKGAATYSPNDVQRIEMGRFITPFMNKNYSPTQVPYTFNVSNVARVFKDPAILAVYDIWIELEIFGVPYAANTQVAGCAGHNDVFFGTLEFVSETDVIGETGINYLLPLNFKKDLNNYTVGATDVIGQTVRTITFNLPAAVNNASFYLITSNHGANSGGEEYNRRFHYIYLDNNPILTYKPGSLTCEPFRQFNTQGNGIYGPAPRTPGEWQSFSNWCPGDAIPIREISLGNLAAGTHNFKIEVPAAVFADQQGYIPVSLYLQGTLNQPLSVSEMQKSEFSLHPNPSNDFVSVTSENEIKNITLYNMLGQQIIDGISGKEIDLTTINKGVYLVQIQFMDNSVATHKLIRN